MFKRAERKKAKLRLAMFGPSGSGKTYSALLVAQGLGGKIALIDTEQGSGELYADLCEYDVAPISAPFDPDKYIKLIKEAERAGYSVIVIDSLSHAWAGAGGMLEMHDMATQASRSKNSYNAWREVTPVHNKLIDTILQSKAHMIVTARSKVAYELQDDGRGKKAPVKVGLAPVFREGLDYEMTICFDLSIEKHVASVTKDRTGLYDGKCFVPAVETGREILAWLESGVDALPAAPEAPAHAPLDLVAIRAALDAIGAESELVPYLSSLVIPKDHPDRAAVVAMYEARRKALEITGDVPPPKAPQMMSDGQRKALMAHYKGATRDDRLADMSSFLNRRVTSFKELTADEAHAFLADVQEVENA